MLVYERPATDAQSFMNPTVWMLLANDVRAIHLEMTADLADRGVGQMVAFLVAGTRTDDVLSPSKLVDDFWHAFLLRTVAYAEFCQQVAGRFIHHVPTDAAPLDDDAARQSLVRTCDAITAAGFTIDPELWPVAAECSQCHAGCADSPTTGGKK